MRYKRKRKEDLPDGPEVKTLPFQSRGGTGSIPALGTKILGWETKIPSAAKKKKRGSQGWLKGFLPQTADMMN